MDFLPCAVRKTELICCGPSFRLKSTTQTLMLYDKKKKSRTKKVESFRHSQNILHWCKNDFKSMIYTNGDYQFVQLYQVFQIAEESLKVGIFKKVQFVHEKVLAINFCPWAGVWLFPGTQLCPYSLDNYQLADLYELTLEIEEIHRLVLLLLFFSTFFSFRHGSSEIPTS